MKKITLIAILFIIPFLTFSQNKAGVLVGINATTLSNGILKSFGFHSNSFSLHFGAVYETKLTEKISFRPKLIYSQQGDREDFYNNIKYETSYLNIPLNFKFFNKPYVLAGPQIGFLLDTKKKEMDFGDLKTLDYGLNLGVGIDIKQFFIELNIYQGFNKLIEVQFEQTNPYRDIGIKATNTLGQLTLGYNFKF